jgi:WhiB family transcriptional regulator, redox-sensing transcriptional regulator
MWQSEWRERARCRDVDPELFFQADRERSSVRRRRERRAQEVCAQCPVIRECRDFALNSREGFGIWGGMSEGDRIKVFIAVGARPRGRGVHRARQD